MITFSRLGKFGRLGNQMFQIASTIGIAEYNKVGFAFPKWEHQKHFTHELPVVNDGLLSGWFLEWYEKSTKYQEISIPEGVDLDLVGYFQSYKYFEHCQDTIRYFFETDFYKDTVAPEIAVHVRKGDYLNLSNIHPNLTMNYYKRAMSYFPKSRFRIFSDDIEWCEKNFIGDNYSFVVPDNPVMDLINMSTHSGFIIANSSFSWWAAYLAKDKPVVAPNIWAFNEPQETINDRLPIDWIKIDL